jgi:hypothetical protein
MKIHPSVFLGVLYAAFLVVVAKLLQWDGRRMQRQAGASSPSLRVDGSRQDDPSWSHWHAGHFRFGLSRILLCLAGYILVVTVYRHHNLYELVPSVVLAAIIAALARPRRSTPDR